MKIEEKFVETKFGKIDYLEIGKGEKILVYLHGWAGNPAPAIKIARRLVPQGFRIIAPYLPSHGNSFDITADFTLKNLVVTFTDFFEKLSLKEIFAMGHSVGGIITYELANSGKNLVKKAIILDGYNNFRHDNLWHLLPLIYGVVKENGLLNTIVFNNKFKVKKIRPSGLILETGLIQTFIPEKFNPKSLGVENYLFVWGKHDNLTPQAAWIKQIEVEKCNLIEVNGGHCYCTMHLNRVWPTIEKFLYE